MKILNYKDICRQVQEIARETGKFIRNERKTLSDRDVELKGSASLVTYVDKTAERKNCGGAEKDYSRKWFYH